MPLLALPLATLSLAVPPPAPPAPASHERPRILVTATLLRPDGSPLPGNVQCRVRFEGARFPATTTTRANPHGRTAFLLRTPSGADPNAPATIEFAPAGTALDENPETSFHVDPARGLRATLPLTRLRQHPSSGFYEHDAAVTLRPPPHYATLLVRQAPAPGTQLRVHDLRPRPHHVPYARVDDFRETRGTWKPWPDGATVLQLHRWSSFKLSAVEIRGPRGHQLAYECVLRDGVQFLAPKRERRIEVRVDRDAHPDAYAVLLMRNRDHFPNPEPDQTARHTTFYVRRNHRVAEFKVADLRHGATTWTTDDPVVAELWTRRKDPTSGNYRYTLSAYSDVPAGSSSHLVAFDGPH